MKLYHVNKRGMGNIMAGISFGKQRLKRVKEGLCLVNFWNGHCYVAKKDNRLIIPPSKLLERIIGAVSKVRMNSLLRGFSSSYTLSYNIRF